MMMSPLITSPREVGCHAILNPSSAETIQANSQVDWAMILPSTMSAMATHPATRFSSLTGDCALCMRRYWHEGDQLLYTKHPFDRDCRAALAFWSRQ